LVGCRWFPRDHHFGGAMVKGLELAWCLRRLLRPGLKVHARCFGLFVRSDAKPRFIGIWVCGFSGGVR